AVVSQRTEHGDLSKSIDSRDNKSFDSNVAQVIQDFYLDDEISRELSYTKDTRTSKAVGIVVIRYMTMSIGETFQLFKSKYSDLKAVGKILRSRLSGSELVDKTV
ncbi:unnamed protein product, partial [Rotaria sordida]